MRYGREYEYNGEKLRLSEISALAPQINQHTLLTRLQNGWTVEAAISTPSREKRQRHRDEAIVRGICTRCLKPMIFIRSDACSTASCGWPIRRLASPVSVAEFSMMTEEQKLDLRTVRVEPMPEPPAHHPAVLPSEVVQ